LQCKTNPFLANYGAKLTDPCALFTVVDARGESPLQFALENCFLDLVQLFCDIMKNELLKSQSIAWLQKKERLGNTPLEFTTAPHKWPLLEALVPIYYQYLPNLAEDWIVSRIRLPEALRPLYSPIVMRIVHILQFPRKIAYSLIRGSIRTNNTEMLQFILEKFSHLIDCFSSDGHNSFLFEAIRHGHIDTIRLLISMGANPYKGNHLGQNAFNLCYHLRRVEAYQFMSQFYATIVPRESISNDKPSPLCYIDEEEEEDTITIEEMDDEEGGRLPGSSNHNHHISPFTQILYNTLLNSTRL
jgi:hypothetical protein